MFRFGVAAFLIIAALLPRAKSATVKRSGGGRRRRNKHKDDALVEILAPCPPAQRKIRSLCETESTVMRFRVRQSSRQRARTKLLFSLKNITIHTFTRLEQLDQTLTMDVGNLPKNQRHSIRIALLNESDKQIAQDSLTFWLLERWSPSDDCDAEVAENELPLLQTPFFLPRAGVFSENECSEIVSAAKTYGAKFKDAVVGEDEHRDATYRRTRRLILKPAIVGKKFDWVYKRLKDFAFSTNDKYWKFSLGKGGCRQHESMQFLEYNAADRGFYDWHLDQGMYGGASKRKLSLTVQLSSSNAYSGGSLQVKIGKGVDVLPRSRGSVTIFPSYVLHRVEPVTRGTRFALVLWFTGCDSFT